MAVVLHGSARDCQDFCVRPVIRHAFTKRSLNMTANWVFASDHSRGGRFHSAAAWFKSRYSSLVAASSDGKCPLGPVENQDSTRSLFVIQASDGTIRFN